MKSLIFLLLFLLFGSCSEEASLHAQLIGKWKWLSSSGGIDGRTITPESTGDTVTIEFTPQSFKRVVNGVVVKESTYEVVLGTSIRSTEDVELIIYDTGLDQSFILKDNYLILFDECYDCFQSEYVRE